MSSAIHMKLLLTLSSALVLLSACGGGGSYLGEDTQPTPENEPIKARFSSVDGKLSAFAPAALPPGYADVPYLMNKFRLGSSEPMLFTVKSGLTCEGSDCRTGPAELAFWQQSVAGGWLKARTLAASSDCVAPTALTAFDVNEDGVLDVILGCPTPAILLSQADGTFAYRALKAAAVEGAANIGEWPAVNVSGLTAFSTQGVTRIGVFYPGFGLQELKSQDKGRTWSYSAYYNYRPVTRNTRLDAIPLNAGKDWFYLVSGETVDLLRSDGSVLMTAGTPQNNFGSSAWRSRDLAVANLQVVDKYPSFTAFVSLVCTDSNNVHCRSGHAKLARTTVTTSASGVLLGTTLDLALTPESIGKFTWDFGMPFVVSNGQLLPQEKSDRTLLSAPVYLDASALFRTDYDSSLQK